MKRTNNFFAFIKTIIIASLIITIGYKFLAMAGKYFVDDNRGITPLSAENNDSYVFYSQADSDITLFPWNYYDSSISYHNFYNNSFGNGDDGDDSYENTLSDFVDTTNLYNNLVYYFYKVIPTDQKNLILTTDSSLSELINFYYMEPNLRVDTTNSTLFYYNNNIDIGNYSYDLNFSFDYSGYLYSFQCQEIHNDEDYTNDIMTNGNTYLSNLVNDSGQKKISSIFDDIIYLLDMLDNYFIDASDSSDIKINIINENNIKYIEDKSDYDKANYDKTNNQQSDYLSDGESEMPSNDGQSSNQYLYSEQNSYQIVKTHNEYLLILSDSNIVLHFDPLLRVFNGFNLSEKY